MRPTVGLIAIIIACTSVSCRKGGWEVQNPTEQQEASEELDRFARLWLDPAHIAPPNVAFEAREATAGSAVVRVRPLRPEDADWNAWPGESLRLFNNRAALLFEVDVEGPAPLRWLPDETALELNVEGDALFPARTPDEVLVPLLRAALIQEQWALDGDYVERTRAAGPFRDAYLPTAASDRPIRGVVAFPLRDPELHVVALRVTVGVSTPEGVEHLSFLYE